MTMDELVAKFTHLLQYVPYICEDKSKVKQFISCLPLSFKEKIEYENPKIMGESIKKDKIHYLQFKKISESLKYFSNKKKMDL